MDNFTHSLVGWALGQAGLKTKTRKGLAVLILGANMPDIDVFFGWVPWAPLAMHRGFTHGLLGGVLLMPPFLAGLLWLLDRWQGRRGATFKSGLSMHFGWLVALAYIGTITHPLIDLQTTYSVQLLSPLTTAWYHADSLFIIDVWLWSLLAGSIAWSRWREKRGHKWRRPVQGAITAALVYIAFNALASFYTSAKIVSMAASCSYPDAVFSGPPPVLFWRRDVVWRSPISAAESATSRFGIGHASFDPFTGWSGLGAQVEGGGCKLTPDGMKQPAVLKAIATEPSLRQFLAWSVLPVATVERGRCKAKVTIGDARYFVADSRNSRLSLEVVVPLPGPGC